MHCSRWIILAALVLVLGVTWWVERTSWAATSAPPHSVKELEALSDQQLEAQVLTDLAGRVLGTGTTDATWRTLLPPARNVWALALVRQWVDANGLDGFALIHERRPDLPGFRDAHDACVAMDLTSASDALNLVSEKPGNSLALQATLQQAWATEATTTKRIAYLRLHLDELAKAR